MKYMVQSDVLSSQPQLSRLSLQSLLPRQSRLLKGRSGRRLGIAGAVWLEGFATDNPNSNAWRFDSLEKLKRS